MPRSALFCQRGGGAVLMTLSELHVLQLTLTAAYCRPAAGVTHRWGKWSGGEVPKAKGRGRSGETLFAFHFRFPRATQAPPVSLSTALTGVVPSTLRLLQKYITHYANSCPIA